MKIIFDYWGGDISADAAADEIERISRMVRDGYTSGELMNGRGSGWWSTEGDFSEDEDE